MASARLIYPIYTTSVVWLWCYLWDIYYIVSVKHDGIPIANSVMRRHIGSDFPICADDNDTGNRSGPVFHEVNSGYQYIIFRPYIGL